jgi:hypothetical protein
VQPIPFHTTVVQQAVVELTSHDLLVTCRDYSEPHHADWWLSLQHVYDQYVKDMQPTCTPVLAMVQLYSDKTLLNMKNVQCHPVRFTLMNIAYSKRVLNHVDVAYLPSIEWPAGQENAVAEDVQRLARR